MGGLEVTPIAEEEFEAWATSFYRAFGEDGHADQRDAYRRVTEFDRTLAARDRGAIVATAATLSFTISLPAGGALPCAGVTAVSVLPTHRRRGLLTAMMRRLHGQARERDEPLAVLYASESPIYGRYGYGSAAPTLEWSVERPWARLARPVDPRGDVELCGAGTALETFPAVYERARRQRPGMLSRSGQRWWLWLGQDEERDREGYSSRYHASLGGRGYAVYRIRSSWDRGSPDGTLRVEELVATDPEAEAALWEFCFGVDLVARVQASRRPADDPVPLLVENEARVRAAVSEPLYVCLVDVGGALGRRSYDADGTLVLDLTDPFHPDNAGRWKLEGGPGGAECGPTTQPADLACTTTDLAAAYLGGRRFRHLARAGRVIERRRGAIAEADRMFASASGAPWNPFPF